MKWFIGALLLLMIAVIFNLSLLAYAMYALLAVLFVSRILAQSWIHQLQASRECNRLTAEVGDKVAVIVNVQNAGLLPVAWMVLEDLLPPAALRFEPPALRVEGDRIQIAMIRGRSRKSLLYQLQCNRRGYYQLGPALLETGDLFGLHRRFRVAAEPTFLLVYPQVVPLQGFDIASRRPIGEVRMTYRLYEDPTRIAGVRPYEAGDPLNRVHWRATARTGALHSKVYEPTTVAGATLLLDFHQQAHDRRHEPFRSELAVTAAASVANAIYEMGQQVGLITNGRDAADRIRQEGWTADARTREAARRSANMSEKSDRLRPVIVPTQHGPEQLMRILETLARVELTDGLTLSQLVAEVDSRMPRDASVIILTPMVTSEVAVTLGNLKRRGFAVSAILNMYDTYDFSQAAGPLVAQRIEAYHLRSDVEIPTICRKLVLR